MELAYRPEPGRSRRSVAAICRSTPVPRSTNATFSPGCALNEYASRRHLTLPRGTVCADNRFGGADGESGCVARRLGRAAIRSSPRMIRGASSTPSTCSEPSASGAPASAAGPAFVTVLSGASGAPECG